MRYFDSLRLWGMPVYIDKFMNNSNLLHEKIMVIDQRIVAAGSVNWSNAGNSSNDENSLIAFSPSIAAPVPERDQHAVPRGGRGLRAD